MNATNWAIDQGFGMASELVNVMMALAMQAMFPGAGTTTTTTTTTAV